MLVWAQAIGYFEESADIVTRLPLLAAALAWSLGAGLFIAVVMVACSALCRKPAEAAVLFLVFQAVTFVAARLAGRREGLEAALYLSPRLDMQAAGQWMLGARPDFSTRGPIGAAMERMDGRLAICALAAYAIVALLAARGSLRVVETVK